MRGNILIRKTKRGKTISVHTVSTKKSHHTKAPTKPKRLHRVVVKGKKYIFSKKSLRRDTAEKIITSLNDVIHAEECGSYSGIGRDDCRTSPEAYCVLKESCILDLACISCVRDVYYCPPKENQHFQPCNVLMQQHLGLECVYIDEDANNVTRELLEAQQVEAIVSNPPWREKRVVEDTISKSPSDRMAIIVPSYWSPGTRPWLWKTRCGRNMQYVFQVLPLFQLRYERITVYKEPKRNHYGLFDGSSWFVTGFCTSKNIGEAKKLCGYFDGYRVVLWSWCGSQRRYISM